MPRSLLSCALLALAAGCGNAADAPELGALEQPIVNGVASDEGDDAVVYVHTKSREAGSISCTGTMIAPNLVATALHCVTQSDLGVFTCRPDGSLNPGDEEKGRMGALVAASDVSITVGAQLIGASPAARGARLLGTSSPQICRGDIAFVVLDRDLEDLPIASVRLDRGVRTGDHIRAVGYGQTEEYGSSGRRARAGLRVIDVGAESEDDVSISASPRTFVVDEGPCHGDSGGPAFAEDTGGLVGVYSLAAGGACTGVGVRNVFTRLSSYSALALQAFEAAGAEPLLDEASSGPTRPPIVPESGCNVAPSRSGTPEAWGLAGLVALAAALRVRRRR